MADRNEADALFATKEKTAGRIKRQSRNEAEEMSRKQKWKQRSGG